MPLREDKVTSKIENNQILSNAPQKKAGFFVVPKVVE
jgi:aspartyl/glutamyl-tRNA(Asn/Gln) amidotransferase C subunit